MSLLDALLLDPAPFDVWIAARTIGLRVGAQQAAKLAPAVGLAASAALSGWMFLRLCERHIVHCEQVRAELPELPAPGLVIDV